jgi:hypothetical protein
MKGNTGFLVKLALLAISIMVYVTLDSLFHFSGNRIVMMLFIFMWVGMALWTFFGND